MQTPTLAPRARRNDPTSSHIAAERAESFAQKHVARILEAMRAAEAPMRAGEIAHVTGLDSVAVTRRRNEMVKDGLIRVGKERFCTVKGSFMGTWELV